MSCDQQPKEFRYTPIVKERHEIRIIIVLRGDFDDDIVCVVKHVSFNDSPTYEALSYTWGEPEERMNPDKITLDRTSFKVTQNLVFALRHLRLKDCDRYLWVDAICINQNDTVERNNQVQQMARIYEAATHVHVWLGPANGPSRIAMTFLKLVNEKVKECLKYRSDKEEKEKLKQVHRWIKSHYEDPRHESTWIAIARLWQRNYWSRIWIIQEVVFGTTKRGQCIIHCGTDSIDWETLVALDRAMALIDKRCYDNEHSEVDIVQFSRGARLDLSWFIVTHGSRSREKNLALSYLLIRQGRYRATDLRDKVYALLSMVPESLTDGLVVNYDLKTAQVYRMAMREMVIREKKLGVLCSCCRECRNQESLEQLPSWCPDFSTDPMDKCCPARLWSYTKPIYYASGDEDAYASFLPSNEPPIILSARGWRLDTIKFPPDQQYAINGFLSLECLLFMAEGIGGHYPQDLNSIRPIAHEAIWRTLVANRGQSHDEAPKSFEDDYKRLLTRYLGPTVFAGPSLEDENANALDTDIIHAAMPFKEKMDTCLRKRRLCKSKTRFLPGLVPGTAKDGDIICILVGCALPLVLRRIDDHFIVIGESYVHGFMCGEILELERKGKVKREEFVIF
jgi:Heterokaryon incompatibility protein (HET)